MKPVKFLLVVALLAGITPAFAQKKDPVEIYGAGKDIVNMRTFQDPVTNSKEWVRADVILRGIENPDKTATDEREKRWIRDVSLDITVVYVKPSATTKEAKWNPKNWIVLKSKADLVAIEKGKNSIVTFFMPPEIKDIYRLQDSQRLFFILDLSVMGNKVELTQKNLKKFISKSLASQIRNMKQFDKLKQDLAAASSVNEGWLITLPKAPFQVQFEEYYGKSKTQFVQQNAIPTYKVESK